MKMNWEKWIFYWEKWNFEPIGSYVHTTEYLALGKALLAKIYLAVKVYTSYKVYIIYCVYHKIILFGFFFIFYL